MLTYIFIGHLLSNYTFSLLKHLSPPLDSQHVLDHILHHKTHHFGRIKKVLSRGGVCWGRGADQVYTKFSAYFKGSIQRGREGSYQ